MMRLFAAKDGEKGLGTQEEPKIREEQPPRQSLVLDQKETHGDFDTFLLKETNKKLGKRVITSMLIREESPDAHKSHQTRGRLQNSTNTIKH